MLDYYNPYTLKKDVQNGESPFIPKNFKNNWPFVIACNKGPKLLACGDGNAKCTIKCTYWVKGSNSVVTVGLLFELAKL